MFKSHLHWPKFLLLLILVGALGCNPPKPREEKPTYPPTDQIRAKSPGALYDALLRKHVNRKGDIHYKGFQADSTLLNAYLDQMAKINPDDEGLSEAQQLVFWINLYNASVIKMIISEYPIRSIVEIGGSKERIVSLELDRNYGPQASTLFDKKAIESKGALYSLNEIKSLIRQRFTEPRVHFTLVDGIMSAPKLRRSQYTAMELSGQLEHAALEFFELPGKNFINPGNPQLSPIFRDYLTDFGGVDSLTAFINTYSKVKIRQDAELSYLPYDWRLNGY